MATEFFFGFGKESESSRCATINDLLGMKGEISTMTTPLSSLSIFFVQLGGFLFSLERQQFQFRPKFVNLGQFKRCHPDPLPPLRDPNQGGKDQLQTTFLVKEARNDLGPPLLLFKGRSKRFVVRIAYRVMLLRNK